MLDKPYLRAYLNPQPGLSEAAQRLLVEPFKPSDTYVESRGETRADLIRSLRGGAGVLVPELYVLAEAIGRSDKRFADLLAAKDEIHERGSYILEAATGHRSNDKRQWATMRDRARELLRNVVKIGKVGKQPLGYTDRELEAMRAIVDSRAFKNWPERSAAIVARGIKVPSRTWIYSRLAMLTNDLGAAVELPIQKRRKRASLVYFIRDGNRVKIGRSVKPTVRMKDIQTHTKLELLVTIPGGSRREAELHRRFIEHRVHGTKEWFEFVPEIQKFIAKIAPGRFVRRKPKA